MLCFMKTMEKTVDEIRDQILDAAFARFGQYGLGKTTMAEIAKDCDMSAGNLYRYYPNKAEIGAGCAMRCFNEMEALLREIMRRPNLTAAERLKTFVLEKFYHVHEQFSEQPKLYELVMYIQQEKFDMIQALMKGQQSLLAEILAEGNRSGEFDVPDVLETASLIQSAVTIFNAPHFINSYSFEKLEHDAKGVVDLLVRGLGKKN